MTYKDYIATVHFSNEDEVFFGRIEGIGDLVSFEGRSVAELKTAFEDAVEDYIEICQVNGKNPEKAYRGTQYQDFSRTSQAGCPPCPCGKHLT